VVQQLSYLTAKAHYVVEIVEVVMKATAPIFFLKGAQVCTQVKGARARTIIQQVGGAASLQLHNFGSN
jgi:hypothetical protein